MKQTKLKLSITKTCTIEILFKIANKSKISKFYIIGPYFKKILSCRELGNIWINSV